MKRYLLLSAILLLFVVPAYSATYNVTCSNDITSALNTAHSSASNGDIISISAGACEISSKVYMNKGVTVQGAGYGSTIITAQTGGLIEYTANPLINQYFRITGIGFNINGKNTSTRTHPIYIHSDGTTDQTNIRIDHNRFYGSSTTWSSTYIGALGVFGVIDNNIFDCANNQLPIRFSGSDSAWAQRIWNNLTPVTFGTVYTMYIEDNVFNQVGDNQLSDSQYGGRYSYRYNTININRTGYNNLWDVHGNQSASVMAAQGGEFYGNQITTSSSGELIALRGGKGLVFNNNVTTSGSWSTGKVREEYRDSACTVDEDVTLHVNNSYSFGNKKNLTTALSGYYVYENCCTSCISSNCVIHADCCYNGVGQNALLHNKQYWNYTGSYNGSSGVGCGTIGNRPATCTEGTAYWATTQSCSDLTGMVGKDPSTPISGTLYICGSNNWVNATTVTPYTYPHPLTGGEAPDTTDPVLVSVMVVGQQACPTNPSNVAISLGATDNVAVTGVRCCLNDGVTCIPATEYDDMDVVLTNTSGITWGTTVSSACDSYITYNCRATDAAGNFSNDAVIAYAMADNEDTDAPTMSTQAIGADGRTVTFTFSEAVTIGTGGSTGFTLTNGDSEEIGLTYVSGSASTSLVYQSSVCIPSTDTFTAGLVYTQPTDGIEDMAGNDLASFTGAGAKTVTNGSGQSCNLATSLFEHGESAPSGSANSSGNAVNLGVKFQTSTAGTMTHCWFYKIAADTGTHTCTVYRVFDGTTVGTVDFADESESGWQDQAFASALNIAADEDYIVTVSHPTGNWTSNVDYFASTYTNGNLTATTSGTDYAGRYVYGATMAYPTNDSARNYWTDFTMSYAGAGGPWQCTVSRTGDGCMVTGSQVVEDEGTCSATVTLRNGWKATWGGTCPAGSETNGIYTTGNLSADCTLTAACTEQNILP